MNPHIYSAAIIGTGRIGFFLGLDKKREQPASHTMALLANRRIRLVAGCDVDSRRLEVLQEGAISLEEFNAIINKR